MTMHSYFGSSRNLENRGDLLRFDSDPLQASENDNKEEIAMDLIQLGGSSDPLPIKADVNPNVTIELSIPVVVPLTSDSTAYVHFEDDPSPYTTDPAIPSKFEEPVLDLEGFSLDDDFEEFPTAKRRKSTLERRKVLGEPVKLGTKKWKKNMI